MAYIAELSAYSALLHRSRAGDPRRDEERNCATLCCGFALDHHLRVKPRTRFYVLAVFKCPGGFHKHSAPVTVMLH